jgi:SulP family sulfate permease
MLARPTLGANVAAGVVVAMIAIPLNLALAVACGLPPAAGLISGAIAGLIGSLFGGARLNVTGPEVALAPLTAVIVAAHGLDGLVVATAIAGAIQIALGLAGAGRMVRLLPRPVIGGFLAAVGVMVFDSQLPHLVGIHDGRGVIRIASGISEELSAHGAAIGIGMMVVAVLFVMPKLAPRAPAPLVALALAIGIAWWLGLPVARVEPVHGDVLALYVPALATIDWSSLLPSAIALAALASVDSLLCAASVDARVGGEPHHSDRELIAQGVANIACAMVGGMPVAAAVVRSMAAIEARATTRLCGIVQSLVLFVTALMLGAYLDVVPIAALAGVLLVVGARLIDLRELAKLARVRRFEAVVFLITAAAIVGAGFSAGLLVGLALAFVELASAHGRGLRMKAREESGKRIVRLEGPLVFASQHRAGRLLAAAGDESTSLVVDLGGVTQWDATGLAALRVALEPHAKRGVKLSLVPGRGMPVDVLNGELASIAAHVRTGTDRPSRWPHAMSIPPLAIDSAE